MRRRVGSLMICLSHLRRSRSYLVRYVPPYLVSPLAGADASDQLRGYYEHMALLRDHYTEVDALLSGELPSTIANSFQPTKSYTRLVNDLEEEVNPNVNTIPRWLRRGSAWNMPRTGRREREARRIGNGHGNGDVDPEAGERTGLLSAEEKEERRDRLARLALNGTFRPCSPRCAFS